MISNPTASTEVVTLDDNTTKRGFRRFLQRAGHSSNVVVGSVMLTFVVLVVLLAPVIAPFNPIEQFRRENLNPPDSVYIFGTDNLGRDIFSRVLYGGRISLQVGIVSVAIGSIAGTLLGLLAGYYGRWPDTIIMRMVDVLLAFPSILLALAIIAVLGRDLRNVMLAVGIATLPTYIRVVRASTLSVREIDYVLAARTVGAPGWRILLFHILPNVSAPIIVVATNGIAGAIITGAALSFLGLGQQPPDPEWGLMLSEGQRVMRNAWWVTTYPGIAIMITVLAINLLGDGLRDILDPRLRI